MWEVGNPIESVCVGFDDWRMHVGDGATSMAKHGHVAWYLPQIQRFDFVFVVCTVFCGGCRWMGSCVRVVALSISISRVVCIDIGVGSSRATDWLGYSAAVR